MIVDGSVVERRRARPPARDAHLVETTISRSATSRCSAQFALAEAIASIFDDPDFLPFLRSCAGSPSPTRPTTQTGAPGSTNLVKPVYHVGWLHPAFGCRSTSRWRRRRAGPGSGPHRARTA